MRFLLTSYGTSGDVFPFLAIGEALVAQGHSVALLVHERYGPLVEEIGADFYPLGEKDAMDRLLSTTGINRPVRGLLIFFRHLLDLAPRTIRALEAALDDFAPDMVLRYHICFGVRWVCERRGVPCAVAVATPGQWFSAEERGSASNRAISRAQVGLFRVGLTMMRPVFYGTIERSLRRIARDHGIAPETRLYLREMGQGVANLGLWSSAFRPPQADDPPNSVTCGFPFFDRPLECAPDDPRLEGFLEDGPPPLVFSLGSAVVHCPGEFFDHARQAALDTGRRAILLVGENPKRSADSRSVLEVGYVPHASLFPRCSLVIQHGGIGSTAQTLRAGRPMIVVPHIFDQPDIARRVRRLGAGTIIPSNRLNSERLRFEIERIAGDPRIADRAGQIGVSIRGENGAARAAEILTRLPGFSE